jgi:hypothetical protein
VEVFAITLFIEYGKHMCKQWVCEVMFLKSFEKLSTGSAIACDEGARLVSSVVLAYFIGKFKFYHASFH